MSVTFKGNGASAFWGVPTAVYSGRVVSARIRTEGEEEPLLNSDGETDGLALLDEKDVLELEVVYDSTFTPPARGDSITINSISGYVQTVEKGWERRGWRSCRITATDWKNMS